MSSVISGGHVVMKRAPRRGDKLVIGPSHGTHHVFSLPLFPKKMLVSIAELDVFEATAEAVDDFSLDIEELDTITATIEDC